VNYGGRRMVQRSALLLAAQLLAFCPVIEVAAQEASPKAVISNDRLATCFDEKTGAFTGPMLVRSQALVAPDGDHRAYTEDLAAGDVKLPNERTGGWSPSECANISQMFVADRRGHEFRRALAITPTEQTLGNAIFLVDWSPDSRYLLFKSLLFQWGSDFGGSDPVLYDAKSGTFSDSLLMYQAFTKWAKRDCVVSIEPLGFSSEGKVVLKAGPTYPIAPEVDEPEPDSCLKKSGTWLYDPGAGSLTELPDQFRVKRFGRFESWSVSGFHPAAGHAHTDRVRVQH